MEFRISKKEKYLAVRKKKIEQHNYNTVTITIMLTVPELLKKNVSILQYFTLKNDTLSYTTHYLKNEQKKNRHKNEKQKNP